MGSLVGSLVFPLGGDPSQNTYVLDCDIWAQDLLEVKFSVDMVNDSNLKDKRNYRVTAVTANSLPIEVTGVKTGKNDFTDTIYLVTTAGTLGSKYKIEILSATQAGYGVELEAGDSNIISTDGIHINNNILANSNINFFFSRWTKIDEALSHLPKFYDTTPTSKIRDVLNAIFRSDDLLGGTRDDRL